MSREAMSKEQLLKEIDALELRLEEAEDALRAIRNGEVDAIYVEGPEGDQIFTLKGADQTYRTLIEDMNEGAVTTTVDGTILYANKAFVDMTKVPHELIMGSSINQYIAPENKPMLEALFQRGLQERAEGEIVLNIEEGPSVPVYVSINTVLLDDEQVLCIAVTDLTEQKRQEEIVQSERLSRAILEAAGEAIVVCDKDGRIIRANYAAQRLVEDPVLLKSFDDVFLIQTVPENNNEAAAPFSLSQVLEGDPFHGKEALLRKQNQEESHFLLSATHLRSKAGIIGCVLVLTNTTDLKHLEMELEAEREQLAVTLLSIGDGVITTDLEGRILLMNRVAESLTGWSQKEAMGQSLNDVFHIINEGTREPCTNAAQKVLQTREIVGIANDTVLISRDCTERVIADLGSPILSRDGNIIGVVGIGQDITFRIAQEREYSNLINNANAPIFGVDNEGMVNVWNQCAMHLVGYSTEEVMGHRLVEEFITKDYQASVQTVLDKALDGEETANFEFPLMTKAGVRLEVLLNATTRRDEQGNIIGVVGIGQDITARLAQEREYSKLIDSANAPIFGVDTQGRVNVWNQCAMQLVGYSSEEVMSKNLVKEFITDEYKTAVQAVLDMALHGEETANFEFPLITKAGVRLDVLLNATTRRDEQGNVIGVVGIGQDITGRLAQEREYTRLIDTANAPIFGVDTLGRVNVWNQCAKDLVGYSNEEGTFCFVSFF